MRNTALSYIPRDSFIHGLSGTTKFLFLILYSVATMLTYDTRVLVFLMAFGLFFFPLSKIRIREVKGILIFILVFLSVNILLLYIFNPAYGENLYGTKHELFKLFLRYDVTKEELFYLLNFALKYFAMIPAAIIFIAATNPSEFAASLSSIGVSYKISYSVALALRYIPDIQRDYHNISQAQQARGVELGKSEKLLTRMKNAVNILLPLIMSSFSRIDVISNAMELRGFGKNRKRTWYSKRAFAKKDWAVTILGIVLMILSVVITYWDGNRFYNPFI